MAEPSPVQDQQWLVLMGIKPIITGSNGKSCRENHMGRKVKWQGLPLKKLSWGCAVPVVLVFKWITMVITPSGLPRETMGPLQKCYCTPKYIAYIWCYDVLDTSSTDYQTLRVERWMTSESSHKWCCYWWGSLRSSGLFHHFQGSAMNALPSTVIKRALPVMFQDTEGYLSSKTYL